MQSLNINAPSDTVNHYGYGKGLTITAIDTNCFNEYGTFGTATIASGKLIVKDGGFIGNATGAGSIVEETGGYIAIVRNVQSQSSYTISDLEDLLLFRDRVNTGFGFAGITVTLEADIDLKNIEWKSIGALKVRAVGSSSFCLDVESAFYGNFDGKNHTIYNLTMSEDVGYAGFFGCISGNFVNVHDEYYATRVDRNYVMNVKFVNVYLNCNDSYTGALASKIEGTEVTNVSVEGTILTGNGGGIAGVALDTSFYDCTVDVDFDFAKPEERLGSDNSVVNWGQIGGICGQICCAYYYSNGDESNYYCKFNNCNTSACTYRVANTNTNSLYIGSYYGQAQYPALNIITVDGGDRITSRDPYVKIDDAHIVRY